MSEHRPWTEQEITFLRENRESMASKQIAQSLDRTVNAINGKALKLGLVKSNEAWCPSGSRWTEQQDEYLRSHWQGQNDEDLSSAVGHPVPSTRARRIKLGLCHRKGYRGKDWSQEELDYISEVWGEKTIPQIARHLGRSVNAVKIKTVRSGYTGQKWFGNMMSARKVSELLGVDVHAVCNYWIPKCGLAGKRKRLGESKKTTTIILFDDLLVWLEHHQDLWDSRRVELYGIGMEYDWLTAKREKDALIPSRKAQKWTEEEDSRLVAMFRRGEMTIAQMGAELNRPAAGVEHRLTRLDVWGSGKYIGESRRKERSARKEAFNKKALLIRLCNVLTAHRNSIEFGEYWQKDLCMKWDDIRGCAAGCTDCDSCTEFERIKPQYCRVCGAEIIDRKFIKWRVCDRCNANRIRQYQRRWAIENARASKGV